MQNQSAKLLLVCRKDDFTIDGATVALSVAAPKQHSYAQQSYPPHGSGPGAGSSAPYRQRNWYEQQQPPNYVRFQNQKICAAISRLFQRYANALGQYDDQHEYTRYRGYVDTYDPARFDCEREMHLLFSDFAFIF